MAWTSQPRSASSFGPCARIAGNIRRYGPKDGITRTATLPDHMYEAILRLFRIRTSGAFGGGTESVPVPKKSSMRLLSCTCRSECSLSVKIIIRSHHHWQYREPPEYVLLSQPRALQHPDDVRVRSPNITLLPYGARCSSPSPQDKDLCLEVRPKWASILVPTAALLCRAGEHVAIDRR